MADAKKVKDRLPATTAPPRARKEEETATITVTNAYRNQPVMFHFLGGSIRLGPLESQDIDRACLASPELAQMVLTGIVTVRDAEPSETPRGDGEITRSDLPAVIAARESAPSSAKSKEE